MITDHRLRAQLDKLYVVSIPPGMITDNPARVLVIAIRKFQSLQG